MAESTQDTQAAYSIRIKAAWHAGAKIGAAGEMLCLIFRVQSVLAFCASLAVILWLIFHGYSTLVCGLIGLGCIFQVLLFLCLAQFVDALAKAQMETLRTTLSCLCLSKGLPDGFLPADDEKDEPAA